MCLLLGDVDFSNLKKLDEPYITTRRKPVKFYEHYIQYDKKLIWKNLNCK